MAVVINEFEATGEPAKEGKADAAAPKHKPLPHEIRRDLRAVAMRAARVWPR